MKTKLKLPIEVGKTYYLSNGRKVRIYATDGGYSTPIHGAELQSEGWVAKQWHIDGTHPTYDYLNIIFEEWEPKDKELVWANKEEDSLIRMVGFYDKINHSLFSYKGKRNGWEFKYYAPYEEKWPDWAKKAYKKLED